MLVVSDDLDLGFGDRVEESVDIPMTTQAGDVELSINSMVGLSSPKTMKVKGMIAQ